MPTITPESSRMAWQSMSRDMSVSDCLINWERVRIESGTALAKPRAYR